jgi:hypothetical protein
MQVTYKPNNLYYTFRQHSLLKILNPNSLLVYVGKNINCNIQLKLRITFEKALMGLWRHIKTAFMSQASFQIKLLRETMVNMSHTLLLHLTMVELTENIKLKINKS